MDSILLHMTTRLKIAVGQEAPSMPLVLPMLHISTQSPFTVRHDQRKIHRSHHLLTLQLQRPHRVQIVWQDHQLEHHKTVTYEQRQFHWECKALRALTVFARVHIKNSFSW